MAKPKIFISHSSADMIFANKLGSDLDAAGAQILMHDNYIGREPFPPLVEPVVTDCEWFLLVLTPNAIASKSVCEEVEYAQRLHRQHKINEMIYLKATDIDDEKIPSAWRRRPLRYHLLDATLNFGYEIALYQILGYLGLDIDLSPDIPSWARNIDLLPSQQPDVKVSQEIFISYRHDDSTAGYAGHLRADLVRRYGENKIFMDLSIEPGVDFMDTLEKAVGSCAVLLAVIGRHWLTVTDVKTGKTRLDNPDDWVRVEIVTALRRNIRVIPLLFHRATMPNAHDLPDDLKPLARRQAHEITDQRWDYDVGSLVSVIDKIVGY